METSVHRKKSTGASGDYARVAEALRYIAACRSDQPRLAEIAAHVGLSEHHFQRLFRRWAGVSPKRFLQYLTAEHAKRLLRDGASVLDAAHATGLSAPSRLHDLLVTLEAVTPGEYKRRGAGMTIRYGFGETPFGEALVAVTARGVCELSFGEPRRRAAQTRALAGRWPDSDRCRDDAAAGGVLERVFGPAAGREPISVLARGTNFEIRVWEALLRLPTGTAASYGSIAAALGTPSAARAVGRAVGRNAVAYLIPCHRIIRSTGALGDYRWGTTRKRAMLAWESAHMPGP